MLIAFIVCLSHVSVCLAKNLYVGDTKLNLRSGRGTQYRIITTLDPGQPVTALSTAGEWTKIGTTDGNEGWVVSRYLTEDKPPDVKIEDLNIQLETLLGKLEMADIENRKLTEENISLTTRFNENSIRLEKLEKSFNELKESSSQYLTLKEEYDTLVKDLNKKNKVIQKLEEKIGDQHISVAIKWSLTGAGILLVGYFLGSRNKRKRSSLL